MPYTEMLKTIRTGAGNFFKGGRTMDNQQTKSGDIIRLEHISISFDDEIILDDLNLTIKDKEFVTLLGPSGCGKTTTLRIIGGFAQPDEGVVYFDDEDITKLPPHKRNVNTVFQKYSLFPHLNVIENVSFGLKLKKLPKDKINALATDMLRLVGLEGFEKRSVDSLSGGQQQRVAIARALVNSPRVLLLDEPLGALDLKLRKELQIELKRIQKQTGITFIYVTHDQEEALTMSDTVVVMNKGVIQQIGTPTDIYNEPKNAFVAHFIGESNIIDGHMLGDEKVEFSGRIFRCVDRGFEVNETVDVVIRPEDILVTKPEDGMIIGVVESVTFMGMHYVITVDSGGYRWQIRSTVAPVEGAEVGLSIEPDGIHVMHKMQEDIQERIQEVLASEE